MIGVIGYGMVGKAVVNGFANTDRLFSDPQYNDMSVEYIVSKNPDAIFVCVPTPTDDSDYSILRGVLQQIKDAKYTGITVVKSTVLPQYIEDFDVLYNPEFLSRATSFDDFVNPPLLLIGGDEAKAKELLQIYKRGSTVMTDNVFITDIKTAALTKYTMNSFYATKIAFMNQMYDVAQKVGVDWNEMIPILKAQPWMGTHHFDVPGPDGSRGFGGPCLPKDTAALVKNYDLELLKTVLVINEDYRSDSSS